MQETVCTAQNKNQVSMIETLSFLVDAINQPLCDGGVTTRGWIFVTC